MCLSRLCNEKEISKIKKTLEKNKTPEGYYIGYKLFRYHTHTGKIRFFTRGVARNIPKNEWLKAESWREYKPKHTLYTEALSAKCSPKNYFNGFHVIVRKKFPYIDKVYFKDVKDYGIQYSSLSGFHKCVVCEEIMVPGKKT